MDFQEIKREARCQAEALIGLLNFLEDKFKDLEASKNLESQKVLSLEKVLAEVRQYLRVKGEYEYADKIRAVLENLGVKVNDKKDEQVV